MNPTKFSPFDEKRPAHLEVVMQSSTILYSKDESRQVARQVCWPHSTHLSRKVVINEINARGPLESSAGFGEAWRKERGREGVRDRRCIRDFSVGSTATSAR